MLNKQLVALLILLGITTNSSAQLLTAKDVGFISGLVAFQSDYGERHDFDTNKGNTGFGVGIVHYINFSSRSDYGAFFNDHVKVRSELSYYTTKLNHFGRWVEGGNNTLGKQQLRAMSGSSDVVNFGVQTEFYLLNIHDFENYVGSFAPYVSVGAFYSYYNAKATSSLGEMGTPEVTFPKYLIPSDGRPNGFSNENRGVLSVTGSLGVRYKLNKISDLQFDTRFQYFNSDWVDGLNPNKDLFKENKSNDWNVWFNFGYIYYLEWL